MYHQLQNHASSHQLQKANVDNAQLHVPQFLLYLDDKVVTLDRKISLRLRGIQLFNLVRTLIISEKKIDTIKTTFVSSFRLWVLENTIDLELTEVIASFVF